MLRTRWGAKDPRSRQSIAHTEVIKLVGFYGEVYECYKPMEK
jgi:hypothetical protein